MSDKAIVEAAGPDAEPARRGRPVVAGLVDKRRQQIIEAAYRLFSEDGYEATKIIDIAGRAGLGQGTVYRYFVSKREILDHVFDHTIESAFAAVAPETLLEAPDSVEGMRAAIEEVTDRMFSYVDERPEILKLVLVEAAAIDEELKQRIIGLEFTIAAMLAVVLERGMREGWLRPNINPQIISHAIISLIVPGLIRAIRGQADNEVRQRYSAELTRFLFRGIAADRQEAS